MAAVVPDIPGFRKILPRSDYIIIPKGTLQEERSKQHIELCVTQGQPASEGLAASAHVTDGSHGAVQNILSVDSSHIAVSEQCIAIEGVAEDPASLVQSDTVEEVVASEILSHYVRPATAHKVAGDVILDETPLEVGDNYPYQAARLVIEETLVNSSDVSNGGLTVTHPQVSDSLSVVTVVTRRVSKAYDGFSSTSH